MEKIQIQFNDKPLEVDKGARLIDVCAQQTIEIPRFCYHPGLSVVGSCRMCQVEVAGPGPAPRRLAISCRTDCAPGMQVWTDTKLAHDTRRGVLEFLLKNHPLDCPICDKAGECPLQNYTYAEGQSASRSEDPKRHFRKRVDLGEVIVLDEERCVLCSRCVRFNAEVDKDPQLHVRQRGPNAMVGTFEDMPLHGNYQGNLADICPVGALTLKKFRFKARAWNLKTTESTCTGCSRGCNILVDTFRGKVVRIRPRYNKDVNGHWICDKGRFGFDDVNEGGRMSSVLYRMNGEYQDRGWDIGLDAVASLLRQSGTKTLLVASPYLTNEEGARFMEIAKAIGAKTIALVPEPARPDHLLFTGELGPNGKGLEILGFTPMRSAELEKAAAAASRVYLCGEKIWTLLTDAARTALGNHPSLLAQDVKPIEAKSIEAMIAAANWAEKTGTFTNRDGRIQPIRPALKMPTGVRHDIAILEDLLQRLTPAAATGATGSAKGGR